MKKIKEFSTKGKASKWMLARGYYRSGSQNRLTVWRKPGSKSIVYTLGVAGSWVAFTN